MTEAQLPPIGEDKPQKLVQQTIPGIDLKKIKEQNWDGEHPVPTDIRSAMSFLRKWCKTTVTVGEDFDRLQVLVKTETQDDLNDREFKQKEEFSPPIFMTPQHHWESNVNQRIVDLAVNAHGFKRRIELQLPI